MGHPPRPRLTIRVGVTGHRWDKLQHEHERDLIVQLRRVLLQVAEIAQQIRDDPEAGYRGRFTRPGERAPFPPELRLISALAEGADRLLVEAAPKGWRLQAILPFPPEGYQQDASEPDSAEHLETLLERARMEAGVLILDGDRKAPKAFEAVGTAICLNSDVLVTIWNGAPGRPGGTASVVGLADQLGIPIVRIAPDGSGTAWLHRPELSDEGRSEGLMKLAQRLHRLCAAPPERPTLDGPDEFPDLREEYFAERHRLGRWGQLYGGVIELLSYQWKGWRQLGRDLLRLEIPYLRAFPENYGEAIRGRWRARWQGKLGLSSGLVEPILATPLADHYGWASYLARYYVGRYRSSFLWGYALSWIAVGCAAAGGALYALGYHQPWSVLGFAGAELLLLLAILTVVILARNGSFHERWLAYRSLTERLRSLTYTLPLARAATLRADPGPLGSASESWVDWMHRAVVREVGIPPTQLTPAHLEEARRLLVDGELAEQMAYHGRNAERLMRVHGRLHLGTSVVFFGGILLAILHLKDGILEAVHHGRKHLFDPKVGVWLGVIGLTTPAFAAAVHGFLSQAEFQETALRSRTTRRHLEHLAQLGRAPDAARSSAALGGLAAAAASAMDAELGAWFAAYMIKDVPLP